MTAKQVAGVAAMRVPHATVKLPPGPWVGVGTRMGGWWAGMRSAILGTGVG